MGSNLVIVALPSDDDRVWKISSEKKPHMTLCFLGEADKVQNLDTIMQFVQHATELSEHGPFYLDVDHRGTLGPDEADVLFFSKRSWNLRWINQFRSQLLQNQAIRTAYDSVPVDQQYPEWTPHLTLGYPTAPAKPLPNDGFEHPIYSVSFDRIAVWTGDFEGPDFRLEWPERDNEFNDVMAYSSLTEAHRKPSLDEALEHYGAKTDLVSHNDARKALGLDAVVEHHGVKGMKWGVRKDTLNSGKEAVKSGLKKVGRGLSRAADALGEHFYETSVYSELKHEAVHNHVADELDSKLYRLQTSPKYKGKSLKTDHALKTEYDQDVAKVTDAAYRRAVKDVYGENAKRTKEARYVEDARGARIEIRDKQSGKTLREGDLTSVQQINANKLDEGAASGAGSGTAQFGGKARHAATSVVDSSPDITIPVKLDTNGQIKAVGHVKSKAIHTLELGDEFILEHFGIKGMKWGMRKEQFQKNVHERRLATEQTNREQRPAKDIRAYPTIGPSKRSKAAIPTKGGEDHPPTPDAIKVAEAHQKLKKSGVKALSNKELKDMATRMQLENQVLSLASTKTQKSAGKRFVEDQLSDPKTQKKLIDFGIKTAVKKFGKGAAVALV